MDTFVRSSPFPQDPPRRRRPARRWARPGTPLRWAATSRRKTAGGGGAGGPPPKTGRLSREDEAWLESMRPWAVALLRASSRIGDDAEDAVQEAFTVAAQQWQTFGSVPDLPERTARRRWLSVVLFRTAERLHQARARALDLPGELGLEGPSTAESHEAKVQARELFGLLQQSTTPERWRAWMLHEVDGVSIEEIARQEGRPFGTVYNRIRLARLDFDAALARHAASDRAHPPRRK